MVVCSISLWLSPGQHHVCVAMHVPQSHYSCSLSSPRIYLCSLILIFKFLSVSPMYTLSHSRQGTSYASYTFLHVLFHRWLDLIHRGCYLIWRWPVSLGVYILVHSPPSHMGGARGGSSSSQYQWRHHHHPYLHHVLPSMLVVRGQGIIWSVGWGNRLSGIPGIGFSVLLGCAQTLCALSCRLWMELRSCLLWWYEKK